mmetsp:Transcript_37444/g.107879  ORF Transcript_37444/g.107879 Transcript_37444/m.107879 type:complete len:210 (+) Transcript_37444:1034-1663(+)
MTKSAEDAQEEEVVIEELGSEEFKGEDRGATVSALRASQEKAKDLSYYHAHTKKEELPPDTVFRKEDPRLRADGQGPHKLEEKATSSEENIRWIETYAFSDDGANAKVYVEFPESIKGAEITSSFDRFSVEVIVRQPSGVIYGVKIKEREGWVLEHERSGGFAHEILPEKSKHKLASNGQRITITVAKKDDKEKWHELKKKDIKSTIPR